VHIFTKRKSERLYLFIENYFVRQYCGSLSGFNFASIKRAMV